MAADLHYLLHHLSASPFENGYRPDSYPAELRPALEGVRTVYHSYLEAIRQEIARHPELWPYAAGEPEAEPVFQPLTFDDLMSMPPRQWLIEKILARGDLGMIFGESGSGKTFVVIDLILAAVLAQGWADCFEIAAPLKVAYCAGEGLSSLKERFATAIQARGVDGSQLAGLTIYTSVPQLYIEENETIFQFVSEVRENGQIPDLLIIDTLHAATVAADENSSKDAGKILAAARFAIKELGCAVLLVHHTNKAKNGERGSSAFRGAMDLMIEVSQAEGKHFLFCSKLKDGSRFEPQAFRLTSLGESVYPEWSGPTSKGGTNKEHKQAILSELLKRPGTSFTAKSLSEAVGIGQTHCSNLLNELVKNGNAFRALEDESKSSSNRNPWHYFVELEKPTPPRLEY